MGQVILNKYSKKIFFKNDRFFYMDNYFLKVQVGNLPAETSFLDQPKSGKTYITLLYVDSKPIFLKKKKKALMRSKFSHGILSESIKM